MGVTRTPRTQPLPPLDDPAYQRVKALVIARTGHHYYADKDAHLWERIAARITAGGVPGIADYLALLENPAAEEWTALESAVTINETFFFRFAEQFDLLRRTLLPRMIAAHAASRRLRIWSVGCSTGAEPYSIAVLLHDLLGPQLPDWRIAVTATDIDEAALETARAALYSSWTLRTLGQDERERLFDREGERYRLKRQYRTMVRFERHNMMDLLDPAAPLQFNEYDLILCRNVLIYFRQEVATQMVGALVGRLAEQGYLFVGHAEPSPDFDRVASPTEIGGLLAYRRPDLAPEPVELPVAPTPLPPLPPRKPKTERPSPPRPRPLPVQPAQGDPPASDMAAVRSALSAGDAAEAFRLAEQGMAGGGTDPVPHYLAALGALALGEGVRAEQGFRKALYLEPKFAMAHYLLGRQLMAQGRTTEGRRSLANAMRVAAALDPATQLPEGDGMTAAALAAAVRSALA